MIKICAINNCVEGFKLSKDKRFIEKLTEVVGVSLNPPGKAVVLCVDEKSQIQALEMIPPKISVSELMGRLKVRHR